MNQIAQRGRISTRCEYLSWKGLQRGNDEEHFRLLYKDKRTEKLPTPCEYALMSMILPTMAKCFRLASSHRQI